MAQQIDYSAVEVPEQKRPTAYHYTERRAEILEIVLRAGGPAAVNQASLAERYEVDRSTISRDLDRISDAITDRLGDHIDLTVKAAFDRAIEQLQEEGEYQEAFEIALDWSDWLAERGHVEREPDELAVDIEGEWLARLQHHYTDE
jgi:hypothetical protein